MTMANESNQSVSDVGGGAATMQSVSAASLRGRLQAGSGSGGGGASNPTFLMMMPVAIKASATVPTMSASRSKPESLSAAATAVGQIATQTSSGTKMGAVPVERGALDGERTW
jgi:hypothetical protein